jgi:hypothetical protein
VTSPPLSGDAPNQGGDPKAATVRPQRPILIELASALLVVGGAVNVLLSVDVLARIAQQGTGIGLLTVLTIVLNTTILALGVLVRMGRAWLVAVNVVAVLGFLELISGTTLGLVFGAIDVLIVLALVHERPWFEASAAQRVADAQGG